MMSLSRSMRDALPGRDVDAVPLVFAGTWTWADLRIGTEAMNPLACFQHRYYEKWLGGISARLHEKELCAPAKRVREDPAAVSPGCEDPAVDDRILRDRREGDPPPHGPAFAVGSLVTVRSLSTVANARLPGYLRGCTGVVERVDERRCTGVGSTGLAERTAVYIVCFDPAEVWKTAAASSGGRLYAEIYETYLVPAGQEEQQ